MNIELLKGIPVSSLERLASALIGGQLSFPIFKPALSNLLGYEMADSVAAVCVDAQERGLAPIEVGYLVQGYAQGLKGAGDSCSIELVWSGPEVANICNRDAAIVCNELFKGAATQVIVSTFALHNGSALLESLAAALDANANLDVLIFLDLTPHRKNGTDEGETVNQFRRQFRKNHWSGERLPKVFYDPRIFDDNPATRACLHAKCVVIDQEVALVTSANLTEAAQERNIEAGVVVRNAPFAKQLAEHFLQLERAGVFREIEI